MEWSEAQKRNVEIVQTTLENARAGNLHIIEGFFDDDFVLNNAPSLPYGGDYFGWQGYVDQCDKLNDFWGDAIHHGREFFPLDENRVLVNFWIDRDIAHNKQHVKMPIMAMWEIRDGKIRNIRPFYFDTKAIHDAYQL
jgi:ketosteroid isomerase-like protein